MEEHCQNPLCENRAIKEVPVSVETPADQVRAICAACEESYTWGVQHGTLCDGLKIGPPPEEMGDEPLFRVMYMIDVNASDIHEAMLGVYGRYADAIKRQAEDDITAKLSQLEAAVSRAMNDREYARELLGNLRI